MKSLVISDIHTRWKLAEKIIKKNSADEVILLGDYFDDFHDSAQSNMDTAVWLKKFLGEKNHIALAGNHEFNYMYNKTLYQCSGFGFEKRVAINSVLKTEDWNKLRFFYSTQGFLLTHAGVTKSVGEHPVKGWNILDFIEKIKIVSGDLIAGNVDAIFKAGQTRGGELKDGGITWCDYEHEFTPIDGLKQIFGHTPSHNVRRYKDTENYCLDTHNKHFIMIDDGVVKICDSSDFSYACP